MFPDPVTRLRRFNRAVTREVGALDTSFLGRGRPLGAARVLQLVTPEGTDIARIREVLELDSGLMSRLLRGLEGEGLVETRSDDADRRRRIAVLTPAGAAELAAYDAMGRDRAQSLLTRAGPQAAQVVAAMDLIATLLNRDHVELRPADPDDPAAQACLRAYFDLLANRVPGVTPDLFPLPDPHADSYRPPHGAFLIAWSDDLPVGCVSLRPLGPGEGEVKRLWVAPDARGQGLARRLMRAIEDQARAMGLTYLKLDTNDALTEAIALYHATGWTEIAPYTSFPSTRWFGKPL